MRTRRIVGLILVLGLQLGAAAPQPWRCSHPGDMTPRGIYCSCGFHPHERQGFYEHVATFPDRAKKDHQLSNWISCRHCGQYFRMPHQHQFADLTPSTGECAGGTRTHVCACGEKRCPAPSGPIGMCDSSRGWCPTR